MEEENYAVFEVCFVDEYCDFNYFHIQRVIIPAKDSEVITIGKLKEYLALYLKGSKKSEKNFKIRCSYANLRNDKDKLLMSCGFSFYEFCDIDGNKYPGTACITFYTDTLSDETVLVVPKKPAIRFLTCMLVNDERCN